MWIIFSINLRCSCQVAPFFSLWNSISPHQFNLHDHDLHSPQSAYFSAMKKHFFCPNENCKIPEYFSREELKKCIKWYDDAFYASISETSFVRIHLRMFAEFARLKFLPRIKCSVDESHLIRSADDKVWSVNSYSNHRCTTDRMKSFLFYLWHPRSLATESQQCDHNEFPPKNLPRAITSVNNNCSITIFHCP